MLKLINNTDLHDVLLLHVLYTENIIRGKEMDDGNESFCIPITHIIFIYHAHDWSKLCGSTLDSISCES